MKKIYIFAIIVVVLVAGVGVGWAIRGSKNTANTTAAKQATPPQASTTQGVGNQAGQSELKSLVSYKVPDGWQEASCDGDKDTVYVLPHGVSLDCSATPAAPISLALDPQGPTDCSQISEQPGVRRHVCKSTNIDGHKSLQASTTQADGKTTSDYYVGSDKGMVRVEYRYSGEAQYQTEFDQIANSVAFK
jgi:hypothetical protein